MPSAVVVRKGTSDLSENIWSNGLIERRAETSVGHHPQLPRTAAPMDSAVVGRGICRPVEPSGDREVHSGDLDWRRGNPVPSNEVPCPSAFSGGIRGTDDDAMLSIAAHVF